jgi:hypothetical protein
MQRCRQSARYGCYWVMIIDGNIEEDSSIAHKYHLFKLANNNTSGRFLESVSEQFIVRYLPSYMNNVLDAILKKGIICSSSREILLNYIGRLSKRQSAEELMLLFESEQLFFDHCIEVVTHCYICRALSVIDADQELPLSREEYRVMFIECKKLAANKQNQRRQRENYLGKVMFENDLRRSFDEFMKIVLRKFGFCPYKFDDGCPALSPL